MLDASLISTEVNEASFHMDAQLGPRSTSIFIWGHTNHTYTSIHKESYHLDYIRPQSSSLHSPTPPPFRWSPPSRPTLQSAASFYGCGALQQLQLAASLLSDSHAYTNSHYEPPLQPQPSKCNAELGQPKSLG